MNIKIRPPIILTFLLLSAPLLTVATMEWPTPSGKLTGNFGLNNGAQPLLGDIYLTDGEALSVGAGEVLFSASADETDNFVSPLGNWVAIDHGGNYISVYARLEELNPRLLPAPSQPSLGDKLETGDPVGIAGRSGWAARDGFYFAFFDRMERHWVNPVRVLNPLPDTSLPVIHSVKLQNSQGQVFDLALTRNIKQGRYSIIVHASDRPEGSDTPVAPFRVVSSLNGAEIGRLELETVSARDGVLLMYRNGLIPVRKIYAMPPSIEAASDVAFTRGQVSLDITVQDFARNTRAATYRLFIE